MVFNRLFQKNLIFEFDKGVEFEHAYGQYEPENWIEVSVLVELRTVWIMTQGDSNKQWKHSEK